MKIGIYHVDTHTEASRDAYIWAKALVRSARAWMPDVPIVHFTDLASKAVKGVDAVRRKPSEPMALLRMRHQASVDGDWLFVDTDVIFQGAVAKVFKRAFDIAITTRTWPHLKVAVGFTERMPFNTGVVFSRCPHFWGEVYTRVRQLTPEQQEWMGDQEVICEMVDENDGRYDFGHLKGSIYNYPPVLPDANTEAMRRETEAAARIVHYKGAGRKAMLLARIQRESRQCA